MIRYLEKGSPRNHLKNFEKLVNQQIVGMLDKNKVCTVDVFPKSTVNRLDKVQGDVKERAIQ